MPTEFHNRVIDGRRHSWDVARLRSLAHGLPIREMAVSEVFELDRVYWFDDEFPPTTWSVAEHSRRIQSADLSDPVLLSPDGYVIDGMHRVARAYLDGVPSLPAVRLPEYPPPDRVSDAT